MTSLLSAKLGRAHAWGWDGRNLCTTGSVITLFCQSRTCAQACSCWRYADGTWVFLPGAFPPRVHISNVDTLCPLLARACLLHDIVPPYF